MMDDVVMPCAPPIWQIAAGCNRIRFKPFESVRFPVFGLPNRGFSMHAIIETGGKQFRLHRAM
jgi:hypothetical protein